MALSQAVQDVLYVQMKELQQLSLYCVDDAADWPEDLLQDRGTLEVVGHGNVRKLFSFDRSSCMEI